MKLKKNIIYLILSLIVFIFATPGYCQKHKNDKESKLIIQHVKRLSKATILKLMDTIKLNFRTYHPQGMVKIGKHFYLSSVETIIKPDKFENFKDGYDRSPGEGVGHLFKFDHSGNLIAKINLGEGTVYHPGGIDFDGKYLWVPVSEYRPNSRSIIYRVNAENLEVTKVFRFNDHIGALACDRHDNTLIGIGWGSRRFYIWKLPYWIESINLVNIDEYEIPEFEMKLNGNHYIDYQDCHYIPDKYMLCSGVNKYNVPNVGDIAFGGLDLFDIELKLAVHQIPINFWIKPDLVMSYNPFYFEIFENHLRFYFIPEDDESNLYIIDAIN
jgi:hypothetical protein